MRLMLPMSDSEKQSLMCDAAAATQFGRLHTIREESFPDETLVVSAKFSDSFGFVDHPRLTTLQPQGILADFRCDCADYRRTHRFCTHCAALANAFFDEICTVSTTPEKDAPVEAPIVSLFPRTPPTPPPVKQISYQFCNCSADLYPGKVQPRIPLARYYKMYGENARARSLYRHCSRWGGSCFGFTTTASMFYLPDDPITVPDFKVNALYPADLPLTARSKQLHMTLHTFIECMQISQYHPTIQQPRTNRLRDPNCLDELCQRVLHFQQTKTDPVCLGVYRSAKLNGGHSVLPFWLETTANGQDRLHIYDPNHPMVTRFAYLDKDENGHHTNWRFPMFDNLEYSSATGGQISFDAYENFKQVWNERGSEKPAAMMSVSRNVAIANTDGQILFRITDEGTESFCDDIYQILLTDMADESEEQVMLNLPAGRYLVRNEDPQRESLDVMLTHTQQSVTVRTNAAELEIMADDASMTVWARIAQDGRSYCIDLDAIFEDECHTIQLEGTTGEGGLTFGCYNGTLRAAGPIDEANTNLYIDEELSDLSSIERQKVISFQEEPVKLKKRNLITCTEQSETTSDVTD